MEHAVFSKGAFH